MDNYKKLSEELLKKDNIDPANIPDSERTVFEQLLDKHLNSGKSKQVLWRIIMRSKTTKFAVAAALIIAAILLLQKGSVNIITPAFGLDEVVAAINKTKWMHIKYEIDQLPGAQELVRTPETWESVNPHKLIQIYGNGSISIDEEDGLGKFTLFDKKANKITISYSETKISDTQPSSLENLFRNQLYEVEKAGAKVTFRNGIFQGYKVKLIDVDTTGFSAPGFKMTLFVNPQTLLPIKFNLEKVDGRDVKASGMIDFPEKVPSDIYELGAPRDAKIIEENQENK